MLNWLHVRQPTSVGMCIWPRCPESQLAVPVLPTASHPLRLASPLPTLQWGAVMQYLWILRMPDRERGKDDVQ